MIEVLYMIHPLRNATWIRMYLGPVYTKCQMMWQLRNDASSTILMENNGVAQTWVAIPFWSDSIVFNDKESLASSQSCCSIDADAWYKRTLTLSERGFLWLTPISVNTVYVYSVPNFFRTQEKAMSLLGSISFSVDTPLRKWPNHFSVGHKNKQNKRTPKTKYDIFVKSTSNNGRLHYILVVILEPRNLMVLEPKLCADFI